MGDRVGGWRDRERERERETDRGRDRERTVDQTDRHYNNQLLPLAWSKYVPN